MSFVAGHFKYMRKIRENDSLYCILNGSIGFIDFEKFRICLKNQIPKDLTFRWWSFLKIEINFRNKWSIVNLNVSIIFLAYDNVGFASEIKSLCQILAEILKIFAFCGGYFDFFPIKKSSMMTGCHQSDL